MRQLPTGQVTFLFTDVEGSTRKPSTRRGEPWSSSKRWLTPWTPPMPEPPLGKATIAVPPVSRQRRLAFTALAALLVVLFGIMFFGLTSLAIGWFEDLEGVAGPVTEIGYGALVGLILTVGVASQLRHPERKIAGLQQAALVIPSLAAGSLLARDTQNLEPLVIVVPALALLWALHPARAALLRPAIRISPPLVAIALLGAVPLVAYALAMGAAAQELAGPPHHVQRLSTMAALAVGIELTALLAALHTPGWRIPTWSVATALIVFGVASILFPHHPAAVGSAWGGLAIGCGLLFAAVAEWEATRSGS